MSVSTSTVAILFFCVFLPLALCLVNVLLHFVFWYRTYYGERYVDRVVYNLLIQPTKSFRDDARVFWRVWRILTHRETPLLIAPETSSIYENEFFSGDFRRSSNICTVRHLINSHEPLTCPPLCIKLVICRQTSAFYRLETLQVLYKVITVRDPNNEATNSLTFRKTLVI